MKTEDMIRIGQVSSVNAVNGSCRVAFDDLDGKVSGELQILRRHTDKAKYFSLPDVGEHVTCLFLPNGSQEGIVIGSQYTARNLPKDGKIGVYRVDFDDETRIEYDLNTHTALVKTEHHVVVECGDAKVTAEKDVVVKSPAVRVEAGDILLIGNVRIQGDVTIQGDLETDGHIHATGTILDEEGNTDHHAHGGEA